MKVFLLHDGGPHGLLFQNAWDCLESLQRAGHQLAGREAVLEPDERGYYFLIVESPYIAEQFLQYLQACAGVLAVHTGTLDGIPLDFDAVTTKPEIWQRLHGVMMRTYESRA